ncbi:MAG: acetyltransferase, ribosomal protein N-acetylase [Bacteroidetes bacterium]|nr:acetyltransferase, ribosomal protein N-acetylase [Bacteroidota bacterium]
MENIFDFEKEYILENEAVLLRPLRMADSGLLLPISTAEPEIWSYSLITAAGEKNLERYIQLALDAKAAKTEFPFIVFDKRTQQCVGSTRFYDMQLTNRSLQLGYTWYGKAAQGTGLNANCKFLLLRFAFEELNMERVEFRADNNNAKSIAAMKGIGCTVEGVLRQNVIKPDGMRRDSIILSILKSEWNERVKEHLLKKISK